MLNLNKLNINEHYRKTESEVLLVPHYAYTWPLAAPNFPTLDNYSPTPYKYHFHGKVFSVKV